MGVVDHTEMTFRFFAGGSEVIYSRILFITKYFHVVASAVMDTVGADLIVIFCGRFKTRNPDLAYFVTQFRQTIAATFYLPCAGHVRILANLNISIGQSSHSESHTDRVLGIVLKHRGRSDQFTLNIVGPFDRLRDRRVCHPELVEGSLRALQHISGSGRSHQHSRILDECSSFHIYLVIRYFFTAARTASPRRFLSKTVPSGPIRMMYGI